MPPGQSRRLNVMGRNKVEIKDGITTKKFGSHLSYVTEDAIYEKLKGTGLAPELVYSGQDMIEHRFVEGPTLYDLLTFAINDAAELDLNFRRFFAWYEPFNRVTGQTLGNIDFRKLIWNGDRMLCIDFEHCKVGHIETDFAKLISQIYLVPQPFDDKAKDICLIFARGARDYFSLNPVTFSDQIKRELQRVCKLLKIFYDPKAADELCRSIEALLTENRS